MRKNRQTGNVIPSQPLQQIRSGLGGLLFAIPDLIWDLLTSRLVDPTVEQRDDGGGAQWDDEVVRYLKTQSTSCG